MGDEETPAPVSYTYPIVSVRDAIGTPGDDAAQDHEDENATMIALLKAILREISVLNENLHELRTSGMAQFLDEVIHG